MRGQRMRTAPPCRSAGIDALLSVMLALRAQTRKTAEKRCHDISGAVRQHGDEVLLLKPERIDELRTGAAAREVSSTGQRVE